MNEAGPGGFSGARGGCDVNGVLCALCFGLRREADCPHGRPRARAELDAEHERRRAHRGHHTPAASATALAQIAKRTGSSGASESKNWRFTPVARDLACSIA